MAILPYERSLVQRLANKPFVLIGVNNDLDRDTLKKIQEDSQMTWRNFWDGPNGPIATTWGIEGFPMFFVLDTRGIIRETIGGMPRDRSELDKAVERVLALSEGAGGKN